MSNLKHLQKIQVIIQRVVQASNGLIICHKLNKSVFSNLNRHLCVHNFTKGEWMAFASLLKCKKVEKYFKHLILLLHVLLRFLNEDVPVTASGGVISSNHLVQKRCENTSLWPVSRNCS